MWCRTRDLRLLRLAVVSWRDSDSTSVFDRLSGVSSASNASRHFLPLFSGNPPWISLGSRKHAIFTRLVWPNFYLAIYHCPRPCQHYFLTYVIRSVSGAPRPTVPSALNLNIYSTFTQILYHQSLLRSSRLKVGMSRRFYFKFDDLIYRYAKSRPYVRNNLLFLQSSIYLKQSWQF